MAQDLLIPPRPLAAQAPARGQPWPGETGQRHQPWLPDAAPLPVPDDFSARSVTHPLRGVAWGLALAALMLAIGRSAEMLDAAYGLDTFPGTEALIAVAEAWHGALSWLGIPEVMQALRGALGLARE